MLIDMILSIKKNNAKKQKMSSSEDHVSDDDITRPVMMVWTVWTVLGVVKMMKWPIGRPSFLT
ncbi:hypothetical protein GIB67_037885 [Kingdonia uniflora]|uniref:Uncharacterized protein n=1 Tax=Kingdonia uniflora TaxID=39325 RepID=A0A7J7LH10_9MAGN|nr:hypothetical protein GIB67_037885 [Kingdonia uniflora]